MGESMIKQSVLVETIGGIEMVKTAGAGNLLRQRWLQSIDRHSNESLRQRLVSTVSLTFAGSAQQLAYAAVVVVGVGLIAKQELTMGGLIACSILAGRAVAPLGQIAGLLTRVATTRTAYRQLNEIMRQPAEGPQGAGLQVAEVRGAIAFKDVTFTYPGAAEPALRDVSFAMKLWVPVMPATRSISSSFTSARPSAILSRTEPVRSTTSCIVAPIRERKVSGSYWRISTPSISTSPVSGG